MIMRWFYTSLVLSIAAAGSWFYHVDSQTAQLRDFCSKMPLGATIVQVREAAQEKGFEPKMEPFAQMRIEPLGWMPEVPACRVFFNRARTVEYRVWQKS